MLRHFLCLSILGLILPLAALGQPAPGTKDNCTVEHQRCVAQRQAACDRPESTSDVREACLKSCTEALASCKAYQSRQEAALAEVQRTGGPKPGQCPKGWMLEQRKMDAFGSYKCFAQGSEPLPADYKCSPGLTMTKGIDAVFCAVPRY